MNPQHCYWPVPGLLVAGPWPGPRELDWLEAVGVSILVNLTERSYDDERFRVVDIPVPEFMAPDIEQIEAFCQLVARAELDGDMLYMHCRAGCGRTGAMAACLLVRREGLRAGDAVDRIRALRDCSVESDEQEDGVAAWQEYLGGQR